jgi:hypothetical protein
MRRLLLAGLLALATARPAAACEDHVYARRVTGVADDGSFVYTELISSGRVYTTVNVADAAGARIAWCEIGEADDGPLHTWRCHGDHRFRASRSTPVDTVAAAWTTRLGVTAPLVAAPEVPLGVTQAMCARVRPVIGEVEIGCDATTATARASPSSALVFLEFQITPFRFCGGTSTHDEMIWLSRSELAQRLRHRGSLFTARKRWTLARTALEALRWLAPDDANAGRLLERVRDAGG